MKVLFIIYADLEFLLEKMSTRHNNPQKLSTTKINEHTASGYSFFKSCSFDTAKNKLDYDRSKNCMKNFCLDLRKHATKIINYEKKKKEMIPLTNKGRKLHREQKACYICKREFSANDKKILKG